MDKLKDMNKLSKEDKELVFRDLSARLPYGVRVKVWTKDGFTEEGVLDLAHNYGDVFLDAFYLNKIVDIKPYLRHPSDMTEKEVKELVKIQISKYGSGSDYNNIISIDRIYTTLDRHSWSVWLRYKRKDGDIVETCFIVGRVNWETTLAEIDYLNSIHVDYRGMIENGLAYRAPKGMYDIK